MERERIAAMIGYVVFVIPLVTEGESEFCRFHANQSLVLLLCCGALRVVGWVVPVVGSGILAPLGGVGWLLGVGYGMYHAWRGERKALPVIGEYVLIR